MRGRRIALVLLTCAALVGFGPVGAALADLKAVTSTSAQRVSVPRWSAVFSDGTSTTSTATTATTGALVVPLDHDTFWWLSNNGTATLTPRFKVTLTIATTGGAAAQLETCSGATPNPWDELTDSCPTSVSVIAPGNTPTLYTLPTNYPPPYGVRVRVHVLSGGTGQQATLSVSLHP